MQYTVVEYDGGVHTVHGPFEDERQANAYADALRDWYVQGMGPDYDPDEGDPDDWYTEVCASRAPRAEVLALVPPEGRPEPERPVPSVEAIFAAANALPPVERANTLAELRRIAGK